MLIKDKFQFSHTIYNIIHTKSRHLKFNGDSDLQLVAYSDASHMLHADAKGHGGIIITFGGTIVATKSFKMKLVTNPTLLQ